MLKNLGIDAPLTAAQAIVICLAIACFWLRAGWRPSRLESSGAVLVVGSYLMVYFFRGYMAYEHMRVVGWYNAIPEIGAILFVAGWWARSCGFDLAETAAQESALDISEPDRCAKRVVWPAGSPCSPSHAALCRRCTEDERRRGCSLPHARTSKTQGAAYADEHTIRQRRALFRLEGAEQIAQEMGIGRETIRRAFGRVLVPGIPERQRQSDAAALLALPDGDRKNVDLASVRDSLRRYMVVEPEFQPPWLTRPKSGSPPGLAPERTAVIGSPSRRPRPEAYVLSYWRSRTLRHTLSRVVLPSEHGPLLAGGPIERSR